MNKIALFLLCWLYFGHSNATQMVSLNFQQTPLPIVLKTLADYKKLNLVIDGEIAQRVTIQLQDVTWQHAMKVILSMGKLVMTREGNVMLITPKHTEIASETNIDDRLPLSLVTYPLNYVSADKVKSMVQEQQLLSFRGKIIINDETNTVIVQDTAPQLQVLTQLITLLDQPQQQVTISAYIVTMSRENFEELGVNWQYDGGVSQTINGINVNLPPAGNSTQLAMNVAKISGRFLSLELSALETENSIDIIANPRLLTSNYKTASIKQGTDIPYEVSSGSNNATTIEFRQAALLLAVTPAILNNGQISLSLHITQNSVGQKIKRSDGGDMLAIDTQEIKTEVIINNKETIVLGGIFQHNNSEGYRAVPVLRKIPVLGHLFKHRSQRRQQRELIIFITPEIKV